jgi:fructose-1,6-bisphosphatase
VHGSDTQWYKNVLRNSAIRIDALGSEAELRAKPITKSDSVKSVIEKFREKYGAADVKKYYSKFDVAVVADLSRCFAHFSLSQYPSTTNSPATKSMPKMSLLYWANQFGR